MTILTVTMNSTVDVSLAVDRLVDEHKIRARVCGVCAGGGGINVARCVGRLGGAATATYTSGGDVGRRLDRLLTDEGIEHIPITVAGDTREAYIIAETATGHSFHIVPPGPTLTGIEVRQCREAVIAAARHCSHLVITGSVPPGVPDDFCAELVRGAGSAAVILDIAGIQLAKTLTEHAFVTRLDRREAAGLLGRPIVTFADACATNDALLDAGAAEIAVTTVGALGAVCSTAANHQEISAPPLPGRALSDACAGDSLVGALTYRLAEGDDYVRAGAYAVAAAAATVLLPGAEVFTRASVESLLPGVRIRRVDR